MRSNAAADTHRLCGQRTPGHRQRRGQRCASSPSAAGKREIRLRRRCCHQRPAVWELPPVTASSRARSGALREAPCGAGQLQRGPMTYRRLLQRCGAGPRRPARKRAPRTRALQKPRRGPDHRHGTSGGRRARPRQRPKGHGTAHVPEDVYAELRELTAAQRRGGGARRGPGAPRPAQTRCQVSSRMRDSRQGRGGARGPGCGGEEGPSLRGPLSVAG